MEYAPEVKVEGRAAGPRRRVVLATLGSLGDLHPYVAVALALKARGHEAILATSELYRERIEQIGLPFHPIRPDFVGLESQPEIFRAAMDRKKGTEYVIRKLFLPPVRESLDDLLAVLPGSDLLLMHTVVYAGPTAAELAKVPWISGILSPLTLLSAFDPSVPPQYPWMNRLRPLGPRLFRPLFSIAKRSLRSWGEPVHRLRAELGLPPGGDPLFEGGFSPAGVLALFSSLIGAPQPDWPPQTIQTGFPFFDDVNCEGMPAKLAAFLDAGDPPIVFTLGSSAVMDAGRFFEESQAAAQRLGRRAVLLVGRDPRNQPASPIPDSVIAAEYAPYSDLFPRAAAIVHQGGVGTTGQGLRAGRPTLVIPWSHDQFDNAARVCRLGTGGTLDRRRYTAINVAKVLDQLLSVPSFTAQAEQAARQIQQENGAEAACDVIENVIATNAPR